MRGFAGKCVCPPLFLTLGDLPLYAPMRLSERIRTAGRGGWLNPWESSVSEAGRRGRLRRGILPMRRVVSVLAGVLLSCILVPSVVYAQASIAGVVKDASGAVLPGVTVEASSPALIEKVRSVTTDGSGQYRIVDLRPGTYTVTFTLTGFTVVKREGIELTGSFNATINADLRVGGLQETITVTGESPIVDTQSVRRQTTLDHELLTSAPTARSWAATAVLIPGIVTQAGTSADIQITPQMTVFGGMGGRSNEGRMQVDGLNTGAALNGGGVSTYVADVSNAQEVVTTTSGGLGEAEVGGPRSASSRRAAATSWPGRRICRASRREWLAAITRTNCSWQVSRSPASC